MEHLSQIKDVDRDFLNKVKRLKLKLLGPFDELAS